MAAAQMNRALGRGWMSTFPNDRILPQRWSLRQPPGQFSRSARGRHAIRIAPAILNRDHPGIAGDEVGETGPLEDFQAFFSHEGSAGLPVLLDLKHLLAIPRGCRKHEVLAPETISKNPAHCTVCLNLQAASFNVRG